ncbi:MAG: DUF4058 family protein [Planctomycetes bacterium]|nr:DUF4058 family protein [Planctomycetota bacterium]
MKSPFPGMDPYIEDCGLWGDFHFSLIAAIAKVLAEAAPEHYLVRIGERSYLVLVDEEDKASYPLPPDVRVLATQEDAPLTMRVFIEEEHREAFVEISEATPEQRLVTCIEFLSPSNKHAGSDGRDLYLRKRQSLLLGNANLIEIDLLRGGQRMPMLDPWPKSPYTLMVARAKKYQLCKAWPAHFRRPLPRIPVPLLKPDPDLSLDLQPIIDGIYQRSRYERSIDYTRPLSPPLGPDESAWLQQQLRAR